MLQRVVEFRRSEAEMDVSIVERKDTPGAWSVEAIEVDGDGDVFQAIFLGPGAKERAEEYATIKYGA
ncbi:MAG TPA: hypothetical protein VMM55_04540 [Thermohalobaculum sp.]|nr:hypothetical protein [Thermohalobaculum sp.]